MSLRFVATSNLSDRIKDLILTRLNFDLAQPSQSFLIPLLSPQLKYSKQICIYLRSKLRLEAENSVTVGRDVIINVSYIHIYSIITLYICCNNLSWQMCICIGKFVYSDYAFTCNYDMSIHQAVLS